MLARYMEQGERKYLSTWIIASPTPFVCTDNWQHSIAELLAEHFSGPHKVSSCKVYRCRSTICACGLRQSPRVRSLGRPGRAGRAVTNEGMLRPALPSLRPGQRRRTVSQCSSLPLSSSRRQFFCHSVLARIQGPCGASTTCRFRPTGFSPSQNLIRARPRRGYCQHEARALTGTFASVQTRTYICGIFVGCSSAPIGFRHSPV